jgi:XisI protein
MQVGKMARALVYNADQEVKRTMDLTAAQTAILQVLNSITPRNARIGDLEYQLLLDSERHHYQLLVTGWQQGKLVTGWQQGKRVHGIVAQMDIRDGLIWVQEDGTDVGLAAELEQLGVPADQIVLAYQMPRAQAANDFATR